MVSKNRISLTSGYISSRSKSSLLCAPSSANVSCEGCRGASALCVASISRFKSPCFNYVLNTTENKKLLYLDLRYEHPGGNLIPSHTLRSALGGRRRRRRRSTAKPQPQTRITKVEKLVGHQLRSTAETHTHAHGRHGSHDNLASIMGKVHIVEEFMNTHRDRGRSNNFSTGVEETRAGRVAGCGDDG